MMKAAFVFALSAALTLASPMPFVKRCDVPSPDLDVVYKIYSVAKSRNVSSKVMLAMFETARVESDYNNLGCGDQDSVGVFQQRPSQGWGSVSQIMDVEYATNKYLDSAISVYNSKGSSLTAGQLAQTVQGSDFPLRYDEAESVARQYLAQAESHAGDSGSSSGGGGAANVETGSSSSKTSSKTSSSSSSSSSSGSCSKTYKVVKGDTCSKIVSKYGISLSKFYSYNSSVNSGCTNLTIGKSYCVAKSSSSSSKSAAKVSAPSNKASGTTSTCGKYHTVVKGDTCSALASKGGISLSKFYSLNTGVKNPSCSNLAIGKAYCIES